LAQLPSTTKIGVTGIELTAVERPAKARDYQP
jgi:hypothetical protein